MLKDKYRRLGAKILYYRKIRRLTQEQLAEKVGITAKYLSRIETGSYPYSISLPTLMLIAEKLDVSISELLVGIEEQ